VSTVDVSIRHPDIPAPVAPGARSVDTARVPVTGGGASRARMVDVFTRVVLSDDREFHRRCVQFNQPSDGRPVDYLLAVGDELHDPAVLFPRLRWGGQFIYLSKDLRQVADVAQQFEQMQYVVTHAPDTLFRSILGYKLPFVPPHSHFFVARKTTLTLPKQFSDRFTYHVELTRLPSEYEGYAVLKQVPTIERVRARLSSRFPGADPAIIEKRARKFSEKIFPLFLTREAAMLKILEKHLPREYRQRVPHVIDLEQDERGYVRSLKMNWLRLGGPNLSQLEFAKQATDLLRVLHETAGVIHLDLRLDNVVLTPDGVCFVDFGSAVRVGEDIKGNPLLSTLFDELMRTSQIQKMLEKMTIAGSVTSQIMMEGYQKVDKAVDLFFLALQINAPQTNPDFRGLVHVEAGGREAKLISELTQNILKPADASNPPYKSAGDIFRGLCEVEKKLQAG